MDLECRMLKPQDAEIFRPVRMAALQEAPLDFESVYEFESRMLLPELQKLMQQHAIIGAFSAGQLKGFAIIDGVRMPRIAHRARISSVYVTPDVRGTGAAESMLRWVLKEFGRFFTLYRLGVRADNERAIGFFKKLGFQEIGVEPHAMFIGEEEGGQKVWVDELQMYWMPKA